MNPSFRHIAALVIGLTAVDGLCQEEPFVTRVEVRRIITEVRVIRPDGSPVLGLGPEDFRAWVAGRPAEIESVDWISEASPAPVDVDDAANNPVQAVEMERPLPPPRGRLIVLLFQAQVYSSRIEGLIQVDEHVIDFVQGLAPGDRVAVAVMTSHLQLHSDFTNDFEGLSEELKTMEVLKRKYAEYDGRSPSLLPNFDERKARKAATDLSHALEQIGIALQPLSGTKAVVLIGWGTGRYQGGLRPLYLGPEYERALKALTDAHTSVFSLDITQADRHSLEVSLQQLADDTGGFFVRTYMFPELAVERLTRILTGHYELTIVPPDKKLKDKYKVRVKVDRPNVEVLARQLHFSEPAVEQ